jgi:hypothetical protein
MIRGVSAKCGALDAWNAAIPLLASVNLHFLSHLFGFVGSKGWQRQQSTAYRVALSFSPSATALLQAPQRYP